MPDYIYVHLDTTSNSLMTKGIQHADFFHSVIHQPKNLLLLDPDSDEGVFESHTGLKIIEGPDQVASYLGGLKRRREKFPVKWIDFADVGMLKQLTPQEIAELLYFGHMKIHLRSPFFYKLQNNFAYFELGESLNRVYYRYLEEFYRVLGDKLVETTLVKINDRKSFFKRNLPVAKIPEELLTELKQYLLEGVIFSCQQEEPTNKEYHIPLFIVEDRISKTEEDYFNTTEPIATLTYHTGKKTWKFDGEDEFF